MPKISPFTNQLAAADKQAGFDYQFYIFLLKCLELRKGQTIGYEALDDVHIETIDETIYIQAKHTIQTKADGSYQNLAAKDSDLWKTIYNWINIFNDSARGRKSLDNQLNHLKNARFVLASNKSESPNNSIQLKINKYKIGKATLQDVKKEISSLIRKNQKGEYEEIDRQLKLLVEQDDKWLGLFFNKIEFKLDYSNLVELIQEKISDRFSISKEYHKVDLFNCLFTNYKLRIYEDVSDGNRSVIYTYEQIKAIQSNCLYSHINKPKIRRYSAINLPENLLEQPFIQQLIDIGDIASTDLEVIEDYTRLKVIMASNIKEWEQQNELLPEMKESFIKACITKWKTAHRKHHRTLKLVLDESILISAALACLDEIRMVELHVSDVPLDNELSNGQFYLLSDEIKIGWHRDWETRY